MRYKILISLFLILLIVVLFNISSFTSQKKFLYKNIDDTKLYVKVYSPKYIDKNKRYPAMVFFFGGGWIDGNRKQFVNHAEYFSKRGIICFLADYRTAKRNHTTPFESLKDAKSVIRFIRMNALNFQIDPNKIIAAGGSTGGHLAAATALIQEFNESSDKLSISCKPNALVLYNPVLDNSPKGYGYDRIGENYKKFSPIYNLQKEVPPTLIIHGTKDKIVPSITAKNYKRKMDSLQQWCDLKLYEGEDHGFFNYSNFKSYKRTIMDTDSFLVSLNYLKKEPLVKVK